MKTTRKDFLEYLLKTYVKSVTWEEYKEVAGSDDPWKVYDFWSKLCDFQLPKRKKDLEFEQGEVVVIPRTFGEGQQVETADGTILTSMYAWHRRGHKSRRIGIDMSSFPGNPHTYCKLDAGRLYWGTETTSYGGYIQLKDGTRAPELPGLSWDLRRVVPKDEILDNPRQWDKTYREDVENGEEITSGRFLSRAEAVATGLFVGIARFEGPLEFYLGSSCLGDPEIVVSVDKNDLVETKLQYF